MPITKQRNTPDGWHSRGYLPHFDGGEIPQFITSRLADSLPQKLLDKWRDELRNDDCDVDAALRKRIELFLDRGYGECRLRDPRVATMVQNSLLFFDRSRYRLSAWVVMPNRVHMLLTPCENQDCPRSYNHLSPTPRIRQTSSLGAHRSILAAGVIRSLDSRR